jgi:hypothetical protein
MALSFDQYRYFSAAWVPELSKLAKREPAPRPASAPQPSTLVRPTSITWRVPRPRLVTTKPD